MLTNKITILNIIMKKIEVNIPVAPPLSGARFFCLDDFFDVILCKRSEQGGVSMIGLNEMKMQEGDSNIVGQLTHNSSLFWS